MTPVTDPALLAQLNGPPKGLTPVSDPDIVKKLEAQTQPSGYWDQIKQGTSDVLSGAGKTLEDYAGKGTVGTALQQAGKYVQPENFVPAPLVDEKGFHPGNIGLALAHAAPGIGGSVVA